MWIYNKKLQYPVKIKNPDPKFARLIISQLGGPEGELGASARYMSQRFCYPQGQVTGLLTEIGTEELDHMEMLSALIMQLTRNLTMKQVEQDGYSAYYLGLESAGSPASVYPRPRGDILSDLHEDMVAEQRARSAFDNILRLADDPDVRDVIKYLRQRELEHYQRFGEAVRVIRDKPDSEKFYTFDTALYGAKQRLWQKA
jgi:spore coat protein JC